MPLVILQNKKGETKKVAVGENFSAEWTPIGVEDTAGDAPEVRLDPEDVAAQQMLKEIEQELGAEAGTSGDWVQFFARPVAAAIGKTDCLACEFRKVTLNAGKRLRRIHGPAEGKRMMTALIKRSFTEDTDKLAAELKALLEEK